MRDLSLHLMDIIQNSISARASKIFVSLHSDTDSGELKMVITDDGVGMDDELLNRVTDPFTTSRTTRKVGLGIPLLKLSAELAGGKLDISSEKNKGTTLEASFSIAHIDRPPLGDISETMMNVVLAHPDIEFELKLRTDSETFTFNSFEVKGRLGEVPITNYEVLNWIREYIDEGIKITFGGVLDEITG